MRQPVTFPVMLRLDHQQVGIGIEVALALLDCLRGALLATALKGRRREGTASPELDVVFECFGPVSSYRQ